MKRILVGTDFSSESHQALAHALKIARRLDATLLLAHAGTLIEPTAAALAPESAALIETEPARIESPSSTARVTHAACARSPMTVTQPRRSRSSPSAVM